MRYVSLPNDLVMEIMSRVPGKSLARFRSVSKQFKFLLSDSCFLRLQHSRSSDSLFTTAVHRIRLGEKRRTGLTREQLWRKFNQIRYNFFVTNKANGLVHKFMEIGGLRFRMLSSHHQLLCFVCEAGIHLCDPVNKEFKNLPRPLPLMCFISNQCLVSFGFVEVTMRYKVVKWPHDLEEKCLTVNELKFEVLNIDIVEDGRLKVSPGEGCIDHVPIYFLQLSSQVHVNGFIHLITSDFQIVSFSLQDETFSTLNHKPMCFRLDPKGSKNYHFSLSGIRGNLWMIYYEVLSKIIEIWKMEESRGGWAKIYNIDLRGTH